MPEAPKLPNLPGIAGRGRNRFLLGRSEIPVARDIQGGFGSIRFRALNLQPHKVFGESYLQDIYELPGLDHKRPCAPYPTTGGTYTTVSEI